MTASTRHPISKAGRALRRRLSAVVSGLLILAVLGTALAGAVVL